MVIVTTVLAILTLFLVWYSKRQVSISETNSRIQLRAYVTVLPPELSEDSLYANPLRVAYVLKNSGQTPAMDVRDSVELRIIKRDEIKTLPDPHGFRFAGGGSPITPNVEAVRWLQPNRGPKNYGGLDPREDRIFIFGKVTYSDVFGVDHWITFSYQYQFWLKHFYSESIDVDKND